MRSPPSRATYVRELDSNRLLTALQMDREEVMTAVEEMLIRNRFIQQVASFWHVSTSRLKAMLIATFSTWDCSSLRKLNKPAKIALKFAAEYTY